MKNARASLFAGSVNSP